jgi:hypothetical protein
MHWTRVFDRGAALGLFAGFWMLMGAVAVNATPVTLYAADDQEFGFDADDVADAVDAGFGEPISVTGFFDGGGYFAVVTPEEIPGTQGIDKLIPSTGTSTWTLQIADDTPAHLLQDFFLVILGHDPDDPLGFFYETENVGLEVETGSPWTLFRDADSPDQVYLAYFLGDLDPLMDYQIPIEYRVGEPLFGSGDSFIFPRYAISFLVPVPEPSTLMLLAAAFAGLWMAGKRPV